MASRRRVLVLNTDPEFLIAVEHSLEGEGFDTTTTWDTAEAVGLLASRRFDAVLIGEHPPDVKSAELLRVLQTDRQRPAFIVVESDARHPFEAQYFCALGAYAVIPKGKHKRIVETVRQSTAARILPDQWANASA